MLGIIYGCSKYNYRYLRMQQPESVGSIPEFIIQCLDNGSKAPAGLVEKLVAPPHIRGERCLRIIYMYHVNACVV